MIISTSNPDVTNNPNEIVLIAAQIGITPHSPLGHAIAQKRVFVWQPFSPGLMAALKMQTRDSALLGSVKNYRLFDNSGCDMQVRSTGTYLRDGAIIYIN